MTYVNDKNRVDLFPPMLVLFSLIAIFYILRPSVLMFLTYQLNWLGDIPPATTVQVTSITTSQSSKIPAKSIKSPPLPESLSTNPERWNKSITSDGDTANLNQEIVNITAQERTNAGRQGLDANQTLAIIATRHSKDMLERDYMDHISPEGDGPSQRVAVQHRHLFGHVGENVALIHSKPEAPTTMAEQFMEGWMNSLGHRRNILSADFTHIGVGCYQQPVPNQPQIKRYCTQLFAKVAAIAVDPIPKSLKKGSLLSVQLQSTIGMPLANKLLLSHLATGREVSSVSLSQNNQYAVGDMIIKGQAGVYATSIHIPDSTTAGRYWIVPGPYITITE